MDTDQDQRIGFQIQIREEKESEEMSVKYYCDFCGKETFHMDLGKTENKHVCPECMKVRCHEMANSILDADTQRMRIEDVKYLHDNLENLIIRLDIKRSKSGGKSA